MSEILLRMPSLKETVGPQVERWPDKYPWPWQTIVREAWLRYRKKCEEGATFRLPGHGVLHMQGREYTFECEPEYAKYFNLPTEFKGVWE